MAIDIRNYIRGIPDFPKPGILFYDISTLIAHAEAWKSAIDHLAEKIAPYKPDILAGIESRGFLLTAPLALKLGCGFIMVRKKGKLPGPTISHSYDLEYGSDTIEIQSDAVKSGARVVVLDDLLATGGTLKATIDLLRLCKADVQAAATIIELDFLNGRSKIDVPLISLVRYSE